MGRKPACEEPRVVRGEPGRADPKDCIRPMRRWPYRRWEVSKRTKGGRRDYPPIFPPGAGKKDPREVALESQTPDGGALCASIVCRISAVRMDDSTNAERNSARYLEVDENGPMAPGVSVRVFRAMLRELGLFRKEKEGADRREAEAVYR